MRVIAERLVLFGIAAIAVALFFHFGRLSFQAALLLGVGFTLVTMWLYALWQIAAFKPYRLVMGVKYSTLREDFKLPPGDPVPFGNFTFTAVSALLFARSDEREYSTTLELYADIPCGAPAWTPGVGELEDGPVFFFRPARDGYQFGIQVQAEWWKEQSSRLDESLSELPVAYDRSLILGFLPAGYIPNHIRRWHETVSLFYPFDRRQRRWKVRLGKEGWTINDNFPERIEHRYLVMHYYPL